MTRRCFFAGVLGVLALSPTALADAPGSRYTFPTSGTVYDTRTKLTWQRVADTNEYTQSDAVSHCTTLTLAGGGWRLPSVDELLTIIDPTRYYPAIDLTAFPGANGNTFWSSTPYVGTPGYFWWVYFTEGSTNGTDPSIKNLVRCVR